MRLVVFLEPSTSTPQDISKFYIRDVKIGIGALEGMAINTTEYCFLYKSKYNTRRD